MRIPGIKKGRFELDIKINGQEVGTEDITDRIEANQHKLTYSLIKDVLESRKINFDPKKVEKWDFGEGRYIFLPKDYSLTLERETSQIIDINLHQNLRKSSHNTGFMDVESLKTEMDSLKSVMFQIMNEVRDIHKKIDLILANGIKTAPSIQFVEPQMRESEKNIESQLMNDPQHSHLDLMLMEKGISKVIS